MSRILGHLIASVVDQREIKYLVPKSMLNTSLIITNKLTKQVTHWNFIKLKYSRLIDLETVLKYFIDFYLKDS